MHGQQAGPGKSCLFSAPGESCPWALEASSFGQHLLLHGGSGFSPEETHLGEKSPSLALISLQSYRKQLAASLFESAVFF